jgi:arylsulfatase A-like enzyme/tetratricopeptide (TPR) repeat protein
VGTGLLVGLAGALAWYLLLPVRRGARPALDHANLLLVSIDTLRADRVGGDLTPTINALAARGVRFVAARSVVPLTLPAHASLMTGLLPPAHGVRLNGVHRLTADKPTLARLLRSAGYRTGAVIGAYVLDRRFGLGEGFDSYDDDIARGNESAASVEAERRGEVVADRALAWLRSQRGDRPFFLWVHFYDPHAPYDPPPSFLERAHGLAYDGEVAYADAELGRIVADLTTRGDLDRTLVVVVGDHGESLGDHDEQAHGLLVYEKAIDIPLVFSAPALPASVRTDAVSLVDVLPSVLGLLGVSAPPRVDGRDLFASGAARASAESYVETRYPESAGCSPLYALVSGRWKYIGGPASPELYDLQTDAPELHNVAEEHRGTVEAMAARVASLTSRGTESTRAVPSREALDRLRALGYVVGAPVPAVPGGSVAPSPTTLVRQWGRFEGALVDFGAGRRQGALATLADLVRERPDALVFQISYARALAESDNARAALEAYDHALSRWPQNTTLLHGYAVAARAAGFGDVAMKAEQAALAIDPSNGAAENGIGLLLADAHAFARARAAFERAIELDGHVVPYWLNLGNALLATQDLAGAEHAYREAMRLDAASPDAANGLGVVLRQSGRAPDAIAWFGQAVSISPRFYEAWLNLGMACQERGDQVCAVQAYNHVLGTAPAGAGERIVATQQLSALRARR